MGERYSIGGEVWFRHSTQEWVLDLTGSINDCSFIYRHPQPTNILPEDVPGLPTHYENPTPAEAARVLPDGIKRILNVFKDFPDGDEVPGVKLGWLRAIADGGDDE